MKALAGTFSLALVAVWLVVPHAGAARTAQTKVALVTVVADASGPIRDLTAKDFIVTEDNKSREVVAAEISSDPMSVVLLVDTSELPAGITPPTRDLRGSLSTFVKTIQAYDSNVKIAFIEVAGAAVPKVDFTAKAADLDAVINRLYQGQQQQAVMLEALVDASKRLAEQPPPRRAIVALDFNSREGSAERTMKDAAEAVHKAGATLWTVSVRGAVLASPNREETFNKISQANGGLRLMPIDAAGLEPNLKIVAHSLASQYTVTFVRPDGGNPKTTKFETKRGTKVQLTPWMR